MKRAVLFGLAPACIGMLGCATIIHHGGKQSILINSDPSGAMATIDGTMKLETPGQAKLKRGQTHIVIFDKEGYESSKAFVDHDFSGWVFGNLGFGGLIGLAVDFGTGAAWNLEPGTVSATLTPLKAEAATPLVKEEMH